MTPINHFSLQPKTEMGAQQCKLDVSKGNSVDGKGNSEVIDGTVHMVVHMGDISLGTISIDGVVTFTEKNEQNEEEKQEYILNKLEEEKQGDFLNELVDEGKQGGLLNESDEEEEQGLPQYDDTFFYRAEESSLEKSILLESTQREHRPRHETKLYDGSLLLSIVQKGLLPIRMTTSAELYVATAMESMLAELFSSAVNFTWMDDPVVESGHIRKAGNFDEQFISLLQKVIIPGEGNRF